MSKTHCTNFNRIRYDKITMSKKSGINPITKYLNRFKAGHACFPYKDYNILKKCIFIHIPKNAGTSVLRSLGYGGGRQHCSYRYYLMSDSAKFRKYYKFTIVRNPYDRLVSGYWYMKNGGNRRSDMKFKEIIDESFPDFTSFVSGFLNKDRIHEIKIFNPQYIYLYDHYDVLQVDFIARYENLAEDFLEIGRQLHLGDGELPVINPSNKGDYREYYSDEKVVERVNYLYRKDFELLNYTPETV